jgi:C4-dicarboxylate-specific signal transduction histidine kinase
LELRVRARNGAYRHLREQGLIVRDGAGEALRVIGALGDVTERHDAEELGQRLAHAARLTAMGELAASIAHEINQPMSAILSNVDAAEMLLDSGKYDVVELREILRDVRRDDMRASEVIRHIRGLANKRQIEVEQFSMVDLTRSVVRLIAPIALHRRVRVVTQLGTVREVQADRIHVQQTLLNLLFNGMDAMAGVPEEERVLTIGVVDRDDAWIDVLVRDRGHGIAAEHLPHLFESFFSTKSDGMGLGLSIARSLVEAQGGTIWGENNAHAGATFRFTLRAHG